MDQDNTLVTPVLRLPHVERRGFKRAGVSLSVKEIGPDESYMRATSLGAGGLYCPEALPRPLGSHLLLEITFRDRRPAMLVAGRICRSGDQEDGRGIAIQFCGRPQSQLRGVVRESRAKSALRRP